MGVSINLYLLMKEMFHLSSLWRWYCHFHAHLRHMTITLCNSHPFTFYMPFHTSLRADQCPIQSHVPSTCTLGLDPCARHSLFGRTDPYYIDNFYSSCGLKRLAATLASPLLCNCTVLPVPLSTGPYLDRHTARPLRRPSIQIEIPLGHWGW